jgi:hypothetical protein
VILGIQAKEFNLGFIRAEQLISHGLRGAFCQTPSGLSCAFYWGVASVWPIYHKGLIGGVLQICLSFWKVVPSTERTYAALSEWPSGSWSPPWPRPFSPDCPVWPERPALERVLVFPTFFHLRMMEVTVFLGSFKAAEMFWYPSPDLCLDKMLSQISADHSWLGFCSDMHCELWDLI